MIMAGGRLSRWISGSVQVTVVCNEGLIVGIRVVVIDLPAHGRSDGRYILIL
jgi:hypothetical protein